MRPTPTALVDALRKFGQALPKRPAGDGWQTLEELADTEGVSRAAIKYRMLCATKRGIRFEQAAGTALDAEGKPRRTTYYRLAKGSK